MTPAPGFRMLMARDAAAGPGLYAGALARALCVNPDNLLAQQRQRATRRAAT
jgi:hypothetical protein